MPNRQNAMWNVKNPHQGAFVKALCVCSAGLLRSPTIAWVLSNKGYNTRAAGMYDYALVQVDEVLVEWADVIVFAQQEHMDAYLAKGFSTDKHLYVLGVPDNYAFRDPVLVTTINNRLADTDL